MSLLSSRLPLLTALPTSAGEVRSRLAPPQAASPCLERGWLRSAFPAPHPAGGGREGSVPNTAPRAGLLRLPAASSAWRGRIRVSHPSSHISH